MSHAADAFRFGLESEYLLVEAETFRPLWHRDVTFRQLEGAFAAIPASALPTPAGLLPHPPHSRVTPFIVEGFHVPDPYAVDADILPKGVEIRTPVCGSIEEAVTLLGELVGMLQKVLGSLNCRAVALSHHPVEVHFEGPQGRRAHDRWVWAMEAMMTYGPDINISLPETVRERLVLTELEAKVNHYAPALTALSLASPLHAGGLWHVDGCVGKSARTQRRRHCTQAFRAHPEQGGRLEFKSFEMTPRLEDFEAYFLLWLALLLDDGLKGRASAASRIHELGAVARKGLEDTMARTRAGEVLERAPKVLERWGFSAVPLEGFAQRLQTKRVPADDIVAWWLQENSIPGVLRHLEPDTANSQSTAPSCLRSCAAPSGV